MRYRRLRYRMLLNLSRIKPWVLFTTSTDCDGMRGSGHSYHWTKRGALREVDREYEWAEGPLHWHIALNHTQGFRDALAHNDSWADGRDRYAERAGY